MTSDHIAAQMWLEGCLRCRAHTVADDVAAQGVSFFQPQAVGLSRSCKETAQKWHCSNLEF